MKKAMSVTLRSFIFLFVSIISLSFTACMDDSFDDAPAQVTDVNYISLYQGSPNAPDLDVYVGNSRINNQAFKFGLYSNYLNFEYDDTLMLKFTPTNASNVLVDSALTLKKNKIYSVFTVGLANKMELLVMEDSLVVPGNGLASIRVVHISPDAPAVDIISEGTSNSTLFSNIAYKGKTSFKNVPIGQLNLKVQAKNGGTSLLTVPNVSLVQGKIYTLVLRGLQTPPAGNTNNLSLQIINNI